MFRKLGMRMLGAARRPTDVASAHALADAVLAGDRTSLARAITLAEATGHREALARAMLERVGDGVKARDAATTPNAPAASRAMPTSPRAVAAAAAAVDAEQFEGDERRAEMLAAARGTSLRIAVTGPPGAGKSTLIDAIGPELVARGRRVAVLAIDPSSKRTGGSILGDKTRMQRLTADVAHAFVRASPSRCALGGIARHTGDAIALCEAAGYDAIIVETVGVGQSETGADDVADMFALVIGPAGGDELQGLKRGITEQVRDTCSVCFFFLFFFFLPLSLFMFSHAIFFQFANRKDPTTRCDSHATHASALHIYVLK
jgi:putative protein kinase ArgK-like GTPase of G3E family